MAVNRWLGHAAPVAQVVTLTVGSTTAGHTFITTINGKSVTYTAGASETTTTIAEAIQALLAAYDAAEFREVVWTSDAAVVTGTAVTAGRPFTVSKSGTGTYTLATPTASSGPNHVDLAANWSEGALPDADATDDILIDGGPDLLWGWENIASSAYASVRILASFEGRIGLPVRNEEGGYIEYRGRSFRVGTTTPVTVGEGEGAGPSLCNLVVATFCNVVVFGTGRRAVENVPAVNVSGSSTGAVVVAAGDVGFCADDDTLTGTLTSASVNGGAAFVVGKGGTVTTLNNYGGSVIHRGVVTTLNARGGEVECFGGLTTIVADPAPDADTVVRLRNANTIATSTFRGQAGGRNPVLDCSRDPSGKTLTNGSFTGGAALIDPDNTTTWSNALTWDRASLAASDLGARFSLLKS